MTGKRHLTEGLLAAVAQGSDPPGAALERGLRHLSRWCPQCRGVLADYPGSSFRPRRRPDPDDAPRAPEPPQAARVLQELLEAETLMEELERQPDAGRAAALAAASPRFHTCGLAFTALDAAHRAREESPGDALSWSLLVLAVVERLDSRRYGRGSTATLQARARIAAGSVLVTAGRAPAEAARELRRAEALAGEAGDPELLAVELGLARALLDAKPGRWEDAKVRCLGLEESARVAGLTEHRVRARRLAAFCARRGGRMEEALELGGSLQEALRSSGALPEEEVRVTVEVGATLVASGSFLRGLRELEPLGANIGSWQERTRALRAFWAGVALRGLKRWEESEDALQAACWGLADAGSPWEALDALLDLALCYVERGATHGLHDLMDQASDLHRAPGCDERSKSLLFRLQVTAWRGGLDQGEIRRLRTVLASNRRAAGTEERAH